jgi:alkylation response protein AidB-like acyl-CoA dehydrogenase
MDFELSKEQKDIKSRAGVIVEEVCRPLEESWGTDYYKVPHDVFMNVVRKFREYGFRGLAVPKDAGGQGLGTVAKCLVYEEIVKSPVMHGLLATWSGFLDPHPALYVAPEWQKEAYLYPILEDDKFYHINISEPGAGSDAAGIETTAVRDGDNYVINGIKRWAPPPNHPGITPKYLLCYAVTDPTKGYKGISLFLVDYPNSGVSVLREYETMAPGTCLGRSCDYEYKKPYRIASPSEPIQAVGGLKSFYLRRYPIGVLPAPSQWRMRASRSWSMFSAKHWIKSGLLAWLMMLPAAPFAALPFAMHLLTCEDEL